jgi:OmpA-OmpF porin, OOP family
MANAIKNLSLAVAASAVMLASNAMADDAGKEVNKGYWTNTGGIVWKNPYGLCWRAGYWTPAMATAECDPDLMAKAETPPEPQPVVVQQEAPPPPPPVKPIPKKVSFSADALFDFDKAVIKPQGKKMLDGLVADLNGTHYDVVIATGHTDRIGSVQYNQKLSTHRANAVKAYLVSQGIAASQITAEGKGETQPVTKPGECKGPVGKKLIACLQPDRRVDIEVTGTKE